jgi:hypothetical protein
MKARTRSLVPVLVLTVLAGGALAYAYFGVAKKDEAAQARKDADAKLYRFDASKVKAITVEAKGGTTRLARAGEGWRIEAPVRAEAERSTVDALVDRIATLRRKAAIAEKPDPGALAGYGLATPKAKVTLALEGGPDETLALGDENPFDGSVFVRTTSGAVELVGNDVRWSVDRSTFDLREKRLLPFDEKDLARVEVTTPKLSYALAREGREGRQGDAWRLDAPMLDAPMKERADDSAVQRVLSAVRALRATAFEEGGDARARGLDRPAWEVRLVDAKGAARTLALSEAPAKRGEAAKADAAVGDAAARPLYARLEGAAEIATVAAGSQKDLELDLFTLREKKVLHFDRDAVARVTLKRGDASLEVRREAAADAGVERWRLAAPRDAPAQAGRVSSLLWTLSSLQARAFADESGKTIAEHGLDHPALEITLAGADGKELDRLLVSAERGGKTYARSASSPRIVEVDAAALASLPKGADEVEEKPAAEAKAPAQKTN